MHTSAKSNYISKWQIHRRHRIAVCMLQSAERQKKNTEQNISKII